MFIFMIYCVTEKHRHLTLQQELATYRNKFELHIKSVIGAEASTFAEQKHKHKYGNSNNDNVNNNNSNNNTSSRTSYLQKQV
ncbi:hypothetical protein PoB_004342300 [Plakobranchus ocellatus]|uniref:Uncharacterized protein n=1 Tax=Plakobranchus ocellatus TaxID=259542 RepID=A0AAV4BDI6_9GAST|nr:hypothetical protein PoB_004342300 [Plakobranchus ocellatus]